jgi:hypothetical protein
MFIRSREQWWIVSYLTEQGEKPPPSSIAASLYSPTSAIGVNADDEQQSRRHPASVFPSGSRPC